MGIDAEALAVLPLEAAAARDPGLAGAKAANLARAAAEGLPVLPGFVIVAADRAAAGAGPGPGRPEQRSPEQRPSGVRASDRPLSDPPLSDPAAPAVRPADLRQAGTPSSSTRQPDIRASDSPRGAEALRAAWERLGADRPLVVRSSSAHEDTEESSMAGRFESVLDVRGWDAFVSYVFGGLSTVAAAVYLVIYLYRWEWQRAIICGVLLLAVEGFLVCAILLGRMGRLERRLNDADARSEEIRRRLELSRQEGSANPFRWLGADSREDAGGTTRTYVFVPILMVTGAALSGVAWVIQRIAAATARPGAERRLAGRLAPLAAPAGGVHGFIPQLEDRPAVPPARRLRAVLTVFGSVAGVVLLVWGVYALSDATETREEARPNAAATTVVFQVRVHGTEGAAARDLAAGDLWQTCRRSTSSLNPTASLGRLSDGVYAGVIRPALSSHDVMRLRGCLSDTDTNRARATILGDGQASRSH